MNVVKMVNEAMEMERHEARRIMPEVYHIHPSALAYIYRLHEESDPNISGEERKDLFQQTEREERVRQRVEKEIKENEMNRYSSHEHLLEVIYEEMEIPPIRSGDIMSMGNHPQLDRDLPISPYYFREETSRRKGQGSILCTNLNLATRLDR